MLPLVLRWSPEDPADTLRGNTFALLSESPSHTASAEVTREISTYLCLDRSLC